MPNRHLHGVKVYAGNRDAPAGKNNMGLNVLKSH